MDRIIMGWLATLRWELGKKLIHTYQAGLAHAKLMARGNFEKDILLGALLYLQPAHTGKQNLFRQRGKEDRVRRKFCIKKEEGIRLAERGNRPNAISHFFFTNSRQSCVQNGSDCTFQSKFLVLLRPWKIHSADFQSDIEKSSYCIQQSCNIFPHWPGTQFQIENGLMQCFI